MARPLTAAHPLVAHAAPDVAGVAERLALVAGEARPCAARVLAEEASALLACDAALVLVPGATAGTVEVAATTLPLAGGSVGGASWRLDVVDDQPGECPSAWTATASAAQATLDRRLHGLGLTAWAAAPIGPAGDGRALGLLVAAARGGGPPARRPEHLAPLAASAAAALGRAHPTSVPAAEAEHLRRVRLLAALAFGVSHALGNIFSSMVGNLHFLMDAAADPQTIELTVGLERSAAAGVELMQALQTIAALPAAVEMGPLDLAAVAREVAALTEEVCRPWPTLADVAVRVSGPRRCLAWGNRDQLREALLRVVFNGLQAPRPTVSVVITAEEAEDEARLSVRDDGPGMTPEVLRRACEPFFTTRPAPHQGLGLTIARGIAVAHRGALRLRRVPGGGTEVTLTVARARPESAAAGDAWPRRNHGLGAEGSAPRGVVGVAT